MNKNWRTVFITGGGSGIGLFLADKFLRAGIQVALFDLCFSRDAQSHLDAIALKANCLTFELDVRDSAAMEQSVSQAVQQLASPDLALNCAGVQLAKTFADLTQEEFERVVSINLFGSRNFAAAVIPVMERGAHLALVSSLAGLLPSYSYAAYNASKFAVIGLAGALRLECKPRDIAVSVICPGEIMTPMVVKELETMHPVTRRMKTFAGTLEVHEACEEILVSLAKRKSMIIPGVRAKFAYLLGRWFPGIMQSVSERMVVDTLKDRSSKTVTHN
jgi:NAD(P)-dependent dehydrogenase (short-subunit alcohol dehydrogenase family)